MESLEIKTYASIVDDNLNKIEGLYFLIIETEHINEDGTFDKYIVTNVSHTDKEALFFIIDRNSRDQITELKLKFGYNSPPKLLAGEGYVFNTEPIETPDEIKIRELKEQLAALEASQNQGV